VSESSRPNAYFQSIRPRTASAACRSDRLSANCSTDTSASRAGVTAGRPRAAKQLRELRIGKHLAERIARHPCGNAARATCAVIAGMAWLDRGHIDIIDHLVESGAPVAHHRPTADHQPI
jgi:hypothetical protein